MSVIVEKNDNKTLIKIEGELTIFSAQEVFNHFNEPELFKNDIEVDLSSVTELDSAGLQILISAKENSLQHQCAFNITSHSDAVLEMLSLSDLVGFFGDPIIIESEVA